MKVLFWLTLISIFHTFIGYPFSLIILNKIIPKDKINIKKDFKPKVSIIIAAHNEETVIKKKLDNLINLTYPQEKLEIIIASDNSTDNTNQIVDNFIKKKLKKDIKLYCVENRMGKTNAQNEAVKIAKGTILIFSDANSFLKNDCIEELIKYFSDDNISYVSGKLVYTNKEISESSNAENSYWNYDLMMRKIESDLGSITAGNGAIYAIKNSDYIDLNPIYCHDSMMPIKFVLNNKKAKYAPNAIAYEKAGENSEDEFKRKVRMARKNLSISYSDLNKYNPFKVGFFSYFYFSHRYLRNMLWVLHCFLFISNLFLLGESYFYKIIFIGQCLFYIIALIGGQIKNKLLYIPYYYSMTIFAQMKGAWNEITGKSKPFWEKAETTR